jgi:hypothetical protein
MIKSTSESNIPVFIGCPSTNTPQATSTPNRPSASCREERNRKRSLIPRFVGSRVSAFGPTSEMGGNLTTDFALSEALSEETSDQTELLESEDAPVLETNSES